MPPPSLKPQIPSSIPPPININIGQSYNNPNLVSSNYSNTENRSLPVPNPPEYGERYPMHQPELYPIRQVENTYSNSIPPPLLSNTCPYPQPEKFPKNTENKTYPYPSTDESYPSDNPLINYNQKINLESNSHLNETENYSIKASDENITNKYYPNNHFNQESNYPDNKPRNYLPNLLINQGQNYPENKTLFNQPKYPDENSSISFNQYPNYNQNPIISLETNIPNTEFQENQYNIYDQNLSLNEPHNKAPVIVNSPNYEEFKESRASMDQDTKLNKELFQTIISQKENFIPSYPKCNPLEKIGK